jgi:hypothetical protein
LRHSSLEKGPSHFSLSSSVKKLKKGLFYQRTVDVYGKYFYQINIDLKELGKNLENLYVAFNENPLR